MVSRNSTVAVALLALFDFTGHRQAMISKIVSGGQTGADRAGLDWAISHNIPHGGWCPKGRRAEDGPIDAKYNLTETSSSNYLDRTEKNVQESDATVIFTISPELSGGSKKTEDFAKRHGKKCLHLHSQLETPAAFLVRFVEYHKVKVLNVAGTRGSKEPEVGDFVKRVLEEAFFGKVQPDAGTNSNDPGFMTV